MKRLAHLANEVASLVEVCHYATARSVLFDSVPEI